MSPIDQKELDAPFECPTARLVSDCCGTLCKAGITPLLTEQSAVSYTFLHVSAYDYSKCQLLFLPSVDLSLVKAFIAEVLDVTISQVSALSVDNPTFVPLGVHVSADEVITITRGDVSVTLNILRSADELSYAYYKYNTSFFTLEHNNLLSVLINRAEQGSTLEPRPLGYSKLLAPSLYVYYALSIYGYFKDKLSRESIEELYKFANHLAPETLNIDGLSYAEIDRAKSWLSDIFNATFEERYRG